jgi:hypothetical protein
MMLTGTSAFRRGSSCEEFQKELSHMIDSHVIGCGIVGLVGWECWMALVEALGDELWNPSMRF